eukprot:3425636-Pyramimonas_sp.AAC.1
MDAAMLSAARCSVAATCTSSQKHVGRKRSGKAVGSPHLRRAQVTSHNNCLRGVAVNRPPGVGLGGSKPSYRTSTYDGRISSK